MSKVKTYWKGIEEKEQAPSFVESTKNEFTENLPSHEFLGDDNIAKTSTGRRDFLKFMGFSVAAATLAACETPVIKSVPYVNKPEEITPGVANWYASTYWDGNDYGSILIKTREARPIFVKGNKDFGINGGAITPRMSASVLSLYNGARLQDPTINGKASTWAKVDTGIKNELEAIKAKGGKVRVLTNTIASPSTNKIIQEFASSLGAVSTADNEDELINTSGVDVKVIAHDAISYSGLLKANKASFGAAVVPDYHFDKAKTVVSIGADFLTNWLLSTDYVGDYLKLRNPNNDEMSRHFQFESVMTSTGTTSDVRIPIKPSEEGLVAAALYMQIVGALPGVKVPANIVAVTEKAANELKNNKGASLVVSGSNNEGVQTLVNAINDKLGNYGTTIDLTNPVKVASGIDSEVEALVKEIEAGEVDALIMYNVNPAYTLPNGEAFAKALAKVGTTISFSQFADETASKVKYVCPDNHFMESWNDLAIKADHYALVQPVIRPLYNSAPAQESMLVWAGKATRGGKDTTVYHNYIMSNYAGNWNELVHNGSINVAATTTPAVSSFQGNIVAAEKLVNNAASRIGKYEVIFYQKNGIGNGEQAANPWLQELPDPITKVTWDNYITMSRADAEKEGVNIILGEKSPATLKTITVNGSEATLPVFVLPGQKVGTLGIAYGYGRGANQENIGDAAFQTQEYGTHITDRKGNKMLVGQSAYKLSAFENGELLSGGVATLSKPVGIKDEYPLACTQTHHTFMGRTSIIRETTHEVFSAGDVEAYNPEHTLTTHEKGQTIKKNIKEFDLWEAHPVENVGHRWGLSIDLSSCIGCGTCVVACHTENNVPVVGKDEILRGRDMHWLRIDRYFSSAEEDVRDDVLNYQERTFKNKTTGASEDVSIRNSERLEALEADGNYEEVTDYSYAKLEIAEANPTVVHMPVMCQHCNHAPCETVCPVVATTHSNEGLNQMTYNRCIGTRYCANNCPYKVRRFNWFNYPTNDRFVHFNPAQMDMGRMVLNPDVTVRARGVMEKCSMCVQRIQEGKLTAKIAGEPIKDGSVQTACSSSCPTDAITFGDLNDFKSNGGKGSKIRQMADNERAYHMLEEVGTKPNVYYQVKVSNRTEAEA